VGDDRSFSDNGLAQSGNYSDAVLVKLYSGSHDGEYVLEDSQAVFLTTHVAKSISIYLADIGQSFTEGRISKTLDFGELEEWEYRDIEIQVKSNTAYNLKIRSQNNGRLKHEKLNEYIPYSIFVDGVSISSTNNSGTTPLHGSSKSGQVTHGTRVMIGDVSNKVAGRYTDFVTITATAN